jgi:chorismate mutase
MTAPHTAGDADAGMGDVRDAIERVDRDIVALLAERVALARRAGALKRQDGMRTLDPGREAVVLRTMTAVARDHGLQTEDVRDVFWAIIGMCRRAQEERL